MKNILVIFVAFILLSPLSAFANGDEVHPEGETHEDEAASTVQVSRGILTVGLFGAVVVGGAVWFFMKQGKKNQTGVPTPADTDKSPKA